MAFRPITGNDFKLPEFMAEGACFCFSLSVTEQVLGYAQPLMPAASAKPYLKVKQKKKKSKIVKFLPSFSIHISERVQILGFVYVILGLNSPLVVE